METKKANKGPGYGSALSLRIQSGVRRAELGLRSPISALCSPSAFDGYERLVAVFILIMFKGFCWLLNWKTQLSSAGFLKPASSGLAHPPVYSPKFNKFVKKYTLFMLVSQNSQSTENMLLLFLVNFHLFIYILSEIWRGRENLASAGSLLKCL